MIHKTSTKISVGVLTASVILLSACGFKVDKQGADAASANGLSAYTASSGTIPGYTTLRSQIFASQCISCHGSSGGVNLETYSSAVAAASQIRNAVVVSKVMPPSGPLNDTELQAVQAWLDGGTPENDVAGTPSSPTPSSTPAPTSTPSSTPTSSGNVTYAQVNSQVFTPSCVACHSGSRASSGVDLSTYSNVVSNISMIQQVALSAQSMPPSQPLSSSAQTLLKTWISQGTPQ
jgi:uncharacterized membrane protein